MRETTILQKLQSGDPSGLEALMDLYVPYVSVIVWNILRDAMSPEDGEEVVSDVFLAAWSQSSSLQAGHVKGWLGAVARNKAKNKLRQTGRDIALEDYILNIPGLEDPVAEMERIEEREIVGHAVDSLTVQDREIFLRYYYYAQTVKEISVCMTLNESTVKTRLRRGRTKLKEQLAKEGHIREA